MLHLKQAQYSEYILKLLKPRQFLVIVHSKQQTTDYLPSLSSLLLLVPSSPTSLGGRSKEIFKIFKVRGNAKQFLAPAVNPVKFQIFRQERFLLPGLPFPLTLPCLMACIWVPKFDGSLLSSKSIE